MAIPAPLPLWNRRWFGPLVWVALLALLAALATGLFFNARPNVPQQADFTLFYASAASHQQGSSLYQHFIYSPILQQIVFLGTPERPEGSRLSENLNPPVVSFLLYPFAQLDLRSAYYAWTLAQYLLGLVLLFKLLEALAFRHPLLKPGAALVYSAYFPALANLLIGQVGIFLFAPLALMTIALMRGHERTAGIWLGLALLLKLFVGLVFIWLLLQRRWLALWWGALIWALGMFVALVFFGVQDHLNWLQVLLRHDAGSMSWNASLDGISERYFGTGLVSSIWESPWASWALHSSGFVFAASAALWLNRQQPQLGRECTTQLGIALALPLMLLLAPLGWIYYFPVLLISAALIWHNAQTLPNRTRLGGGLFAALALSAIPQPLTSGNNLRWELWRTYYMDTLVDTRGTTLNVYGEGEYHWFMIPEVYPLALVLMALIVLCTAYSLRSTQTGA
jgi:hypothetical protein